MHRIPDPDPQHLVAMYFLPFFFGSYWSERFVTFLQATILLPVGWRIFQTLRQRQRTMTNKTLPLLLVRHTQQAVHIYNYKILRLWLVIRRSHYEANWCNHERIYSVIRRTIRKIKKPAATGIQAEIYPFVSTISSETVLLIQNYDAYLPCSPSKFLCFQWCTYVFVLPYLCLTFGYLIWSFNKGYLVWHKRNASLVKLWNSLFLINYLIFIIIFIYLCT